MDPRVYALDLAEGALHTVPGGENDWSLMGHGYATIVQGRIKGAKGGPVAKGFQLVKLR